MATNLIRGIVYSVFEEKLGPEAFVWFPSTVPRAMLDMVAWESINMRVRENKVMKQLCYIPLPKFKSKMLVKMFQYSDKTKRGNACDTSLALLFNEEDDAIFYKYVRDFEDIFEKYAIEINEIQEHPVENGVEKARLVGKINQFQVAMDHLIESLFSAEMALSDQQAFPDGDQDASATPSVKPAKYKLVVCGDPAVGKTSTILQYTTMAFKRTYLPTLGVNLTEKSLEHNGKHFKFIIWDVAGQSKFSSFRKQFYEGSAGVILVYDITDQESFKNIKNWYKDIKSVIGDVPVTILGNKKDLEKERKVSFSDLERLGQELHANVFETSALTGENVPLAFKDFAARIKA